MNTHYQEILDDLKKHPRTWLITGVAGFIGSNLLETLLLLNQRVIGLDNFSTGYHSNLEQVRLQISPEQWSCFDFIEGDIRERYTCRKVCVHADYVLHQAAIGSVPRSLEDPLYVNENNVTGFLNMLVAARDAGVDRFVYAASSSTYGDNPSLPKVEEEVGKPLSPYAVTKYTNELYAETFASCYDFKTIGLRYFNIFGRRQDPEGAYAAVIPKWFAGIINGGPVLINGSGETSRDFCYIDNCVQANILAAVTRNEKALNQVYNVAYGQRTTLNELFVLIRDQVGKIMPEAMRIEPSYRDFRPGDVLHSLADINKARDLLGYHPEYSLQAGLESTSDWYCNQCGVSSNSSVQCPEYNLSAAASSGHPSQKS